MARNCSGGGAGLYTAVRRKPAAVQNSNRPKNRDQEHRSKVVGTRPDREGGMRQHQQRGAGSRQDSEDEAEAQHPLRAPGDRLQGPRAAQDERGVEVIEGVPRDDAAAPGEQQSDHHAQEREFAGLGFGVDDAREPGTVEHAGNREERHHRERMSTKKLQLVNEGPAAHSLTHLPHCASRRFRGSPSFAARIDGSTAQDRRARMSCLCSGAGRPVKLVSF